MLQWPVRGICKRVLYLKYDLLQKLQFQYIRNGERILFIVGIGPWIHNVFFFMCSDVPICNMNYNLHRHICKFIYFLGILFKFSLRPDI